MRPRAQTSHGLSPSFGPGKVILLGEHAVVYGYPAVAGPLSVGVTALGRPSARCGLSLPKELSKEGRRLLARAFERAAKVCGLPRVEVLLQSELPPSMGLGSSGAVAVACARLLLAAAGSPTTVEAVARLAFEMEREFHGTPSGIDHTVSARNELLLFQRSPGARKPKVRPLVSPKALHVVVALAGARGPTRETVASLRTRQRRFPARYRRIFQEVGRVSEEGARAVQRGDLHTLGDALDVNHGLLCALGLSSSTLDGLVHRLRGLGALGAKLTGAGGAGGAVVGLFEEPRRALQALRRQGIPCFQSQLAGPRPA